MIRRRGFAIEVGLEGAATLRVHATAPFAILAISGFRLDGVALLAALTVLAAHGTGHAVLVRVHGLRLSTLSFHGLGADASAERASSVASSAIALGGFIAQAWLAIGLAAAVRTVAPGLSEFTWHAHTASAALCLVNLIPIAPLDGAEVWALPSRLGWFRSVTPLAPLDLDREGADAVEREASMVAHDALARAREEARLARARGVR